jgi:hypothetical protein
MSSPFIHFLLVYSYDDQRLIEQREFTDPNEATKAYRDAEAEYRGTYDKYEVVLVGADSVETIRRTHGHYFLAPTAHPAFSDLLNG